MVVILPKFTWIVVACHDKFKTIFDNYKEHKMTNSISKNNRQEEKFYDALGEWYHQTRQVMKHVLATTTDNIEFQTNSSCNAESAPISTTMSTSMSKDTHIFPDRVVDIFEKKAETSANLMNII